MINGIHYAVELENAVIGICLLENTAFGRTYGFINEKVFYSDDNQKVFKALRQMFDRSLPIDLLTVWEFMVSQKVDLHYEKTHLGGIAAYLTHLTNQVVSSAHVEYHCFLLKKMWRKRELQKITTGGMDATEDERQQIRDINSQLNDILGSEIKKDWYTADELFIELIKHQEDIKSGKKQFITTGFKAIDDANGGFAAGQMIVIGARPSVGKSALMGKIAMSQARAGKHVGIISLEMNNTEIAGRLAALDADLEFWKIYRNLFKDEQEQSRFYNILSERTMQLPFYVSDKTKVDINDIRAKAMKLKHQHGLDVLMIDYLQLIDGTTENKNYNREQEVSKMSRGIKLLANDMQIPVIVLCQLNRAVTGRKAKDRYPQLQDLRESGAIEQDADVVMMLHRDWMAGIESDENGATTEFSADLLGLKWRNGAQFHLPLDFDPQKMKFSEHWQPKLIPVKPEKNEQTDDEPF